MKKENLKKLNDVLDISDEMIGDEFETSSSIPTVLKSSVRTENNLFVGSTKELQELLEQKKK